MKKGIFAICDLESSYACNFMDYIKAKKRIQFQIQAFTSLEHLISYLKDNPIEILLISDRMMNKELEKFDIQKIIMISEGEIVWEPEEYPYIYKYQSSERIIEEAMNYYLESETGEGESKILKGPVEIIGIYSPIKRTLKTSFALTMGQILAKEWSTIYINLEEYSGLGQLMNKTYSKNLTDLMYFIRQNKSCSIHRLSGIIQSVNNLDYIPPIMSPIDLKEIKFQEWNYLLTELISKSIYERIIIDFGESIDGLFDLMEMCKQIYMPVRKDSVSMAKIEQYEKLLELMEKEELMKKTSKIKLPFHSCFGAKEYYVDQLIWGELGDYVRELIRSEVIKERSAMTG